MVNRELGPDAAVPATPEQVELRRRPLQGELVSVRDALDAAAECECGWYPRTGSDVHRGAACPAS